MLDLSTHMHSFFFYTKVLFSFGHKVVKMVGVPHLLQPMFILLFESAAN